MVRIQLLNTVNGLEARQCDAARAGSSPCADRLDVDILRRALKLHERKLSLRHGSEDQNPVWQPVQLYQKDSGALPARSLLWPPAGCILHFVLIYTRSRKNERVAVSCGQSSVSLLARTPEECTTIYELCYELCYESSRGSAQITGATCFTQIRVSVLSVTQEHCAVVSA